MPLHPAEVTPGPNWLFSRRADGDLAPDAPDVERRRRSLLARVGGPDQPWNWLRQVHGARVLSVSAPGQHQGDEADALVTAAAMVPIAIQTADCGAVLFSSPEGVVGAAHAGWRGVLAGIVEATVEAMRLIGARRIEARLGPMIHPGCYEFGGGDLSRVVERFGPGVSSRTASGSAALDLPRAVEQAIVDAGARVAQHSPGCTACSPERWYSHRARAEEGRMSAVTWLWR